MSEMRPSSVDSLKKYFEHQIKKIQSGSADISALYVGQDKPGFSRPEITDATYSCVYFFLNSLVTEEVVELCDLDGKWTEIAWYEYQKSVVDLWQTEDGLMEQISFRLKDCGLEEYEEMWSIGEGERFDYSSDEAFLAEVQWQYLLGITKNCWEIVSMNS